MKHHFLSIVSILLTLSAINVNAQRVSALLQHRDTLTTFTGSQAFTEAYDKAADGDTIFLSPGRFSVNTETYLTKQLTILGSGCQSDTAQGLQETYLYTNGYLYIGRYLYRGGGQYTMIPCPAVTFEGLHISKLTNQYGTTGLVLRHCRIDELDMGRSSESSPYRDVRLEHCRIDNMSAPYSYSNFMLANSHIGKLSYYSSWQENTGNNMAWTNCYVTNASGYGYSVFNNCIIDGSTALNANCSAHSCAVKEGLLDNVGNKDGNYELGDVGSLFVDDYTSQEHFYRLTDEAAAAYLGQDGTQVGLYGGQKPYTPIPTYPHIVEKSIAGQTTANGRLRVYVKAEAQSR